MSYFESLLAKRPEKCYLPLWRLKITDEEFEELRAVLFECTKDRIHENPFIHRGCEKEATLFFAEYWRRQYVDGPHSIQMVFEALGDVIVSDFWTKAFYEAACNGAKQLGIEQYQGGRADPLNDMLYQGGLPMKLVTGDIKNSVWDRFTRGLVKRKINFDELNLGLVASQSQSLKEYCGQMILGIVAGQHMLMPFYCQNKYDSWFVYLIKLYNDVIREQRLSQPFSLSFELEVDRVAKSFDSFYVLKGPQRLSSKFLEEQGLDGKPFFSIQVRENGRAKDTFDFKNGFCRYPVRSRHPYHQEDNISLYIHEQEEPHMGGDFDMGVPHILYRSKDDIYELGNRIGQTASLLLVPQNWEIKDSERFTIYNYTWDGGSVKVIEIDENFNDNIVVSGSDGTITFGKDTQLYWTEIQSHPLYQPDIVEPLFHADKCKFALCHDSEDGTSSHTNPKVQFRNKWSSHWSSIPEYGDIFVRAIDKSGNYVTPIRFINVGDGLVISPIQADKDTCQIKVTWAHGRVITTEGSLKANDVWEIKKVDCHNPTKIRFTFIPYNKSHNQFTLTVRAPFKEFSIVDQDGEDIINDGWIPFTDVDKYQYHLVGQDIQTFRVGNIVRKLEWHEDNLYIKEDREVIKRIPYEGSLLTLFDSREKLRSLLDHTSKSMLEAEIPVVFQISRTKSLQFYIKDAPYRVKQKDLGQVIFTGNHRKPITYKGRVKLLPLDNPIAEPVIVSPDPEKGYLLPVEIQSWGKTLLYGYTRGRICPGMVDCTKLRDGKERYDNYLEIKAAIFQELESATLGSSLWNRIIGWFHATQENDIPAKTLIELDCAASKAESLLCLVFTLYAECDSDDERSDLAEQLTSFSSDIGFQWYWLAPYMDSLVMILENFIQDINNPVMRDIYCNWATGKEHEDMLRLLVGLKDDAVYELYFGQCMGEVLTGLTEWMSPLMVKSLTESYDETDKSCISLAKAIINNPHSLCKTDMKSTVYIEVSQNNLSEETDEFFKPFYEKGSLGNERWFYKRVNAVMAHLNKDVNLFEQSDEIRRSIIYCCKSCNKRFIIELNNKLTNIKK